MTAYIFTFYSYKYWTKTYFKVIGFCVLFVLPLRYTFERVKPFEYRYSKSYDEKYGSKTIVFNDEIYIETLFFTDCYAAYPIIPDEHVVDSLRQKGFTIVVK